MEGGLCKFRVLPELLKIGYFMRTDGACDYYRAELPLKTLSRNTNVLVESYTNSEGLKKLEAVIAEADIMLLPRVCEHTLVNLAKSLQENEGKKIVIDWDDDVFNISPLSNHYQGFGVKEVKVKMPSGKKEYLWKDDGRNFSLKMNRERIDNVKRAVELADMVTVTSDILASVYREYNSNVVVLPNCLDTKLWVKLPLEKRDDIRFGWYGGSSHYEDLVVIEKVIKDVLKNYPQTKFVMMGQSFKGILKDLPKDRYEFHPWVHTQAYPYKSAILDLDFFLIPLVDNHFNRCKSAIKWIEQGALSVPCVSSYVSPYKEVYNGINGIFVENEYDSWMEGVKVFMRDSKMIEATGGYANKYVRENFDINTQYIKWEEKYKELLNG